MLQLHDIRQFKLTLPTGGEIQVYPANEKLEYTYQKEGEYQFYRKKLKTALRFVNDDKRGINDFDDLYTIERSLSRCDKMSLEILKLCGGSWSTEFTGYLSVIDMDIDVSNCTIEVVPRVQDEFTCFLESGKEKLNLFDANGTVTLESFIGDIQYIECQDFFTDSCSTPIDCSLRADGCITAGEGWTLIQNDVDKSRSDIYPGECDFTIVTKYAREFVSGAVMPPGSGWIAVTGGFARPVPVVLVEDSSTEEYCRLQYQVPFTSDEEKISIDNGRSIQDVLEFLASKCSLTVVSDFFNINPDDTHPENLAYQAAEDAGLRDVAFFHITDVANSDASENASIMEIGSLEFLDNLKTAYNVDWTVTGGALRVEHASFFKGIHMLDLTQAAAEQFILGRYRYKYKDAELPKYEEFAWSFETDKNNDFDGLPIEYNGACVGPGQSTDPRACSYLVTNLYYLIEHSEDFLDSDEIVMIHHSGGVIQSEDGRISGEYKLNGHVSFANLHYSYHRWRRPAMYGIMNGNQTQFFDLKRVRLQPNIELMMTCENLDTFDAKDLVKTQLGWGKIDKALLTIPGNTLKMDLLHV